MGGRAGKIKIIGVCSPRRRCGWYPPMAWKIPVIAVTYEWDAERKQFPMQPLPDFVDRVQR